VKPILRLGGVVAVGGGRLEKLAVQLNGRVPVAEGLLGVDGSLQEIGRGLGAGRSSRKDQRDERGSKVSDIHEPKLLAQCYRIVTAASFVREAECGLESQADLEAIQFLARGQRVRRRSVPTVRASHYRRVDFEACTPPRPRICCGV
jgi:hypothetical protein